MLEPGNSVANPVSRILSVEQRSNSLGNKHPRAHPSVAASSVWYEMDIDRWIGVRLARLLPLVGRVRPHQYR